MAGLLDIANTWKLVTEMDLRPLREQAERGVRIVLIGKPGSGRHTLADQMRRDPARPGAEIATPLPIIGLEKGNQIAHSDLIILVMNALDGDDSLERNLVREWLDAGKRILVVINRAYATALSQENPEALALDIEVWKNWGKRDVLVGSVEDQKFLTTVFVPAVMHLLPEHHLGLARFFPLFRLAVAHHLINDTCFTNAAYSLSTGLIEIVPILNIPVNVADVVVLTKNQVFLVYKLGLALGLPTDLQSYVVTFGGVLGAGFFWRQFAHMMVGLIPAWGIVPKVGVAYGGTAVVGNVVLQWYLTGRHSTRAQMRQLYANASQKGKQLAARLRSLELRLKSGKRKKAKSGLKPSQVGRQCPGCGRENAPDASYCQYCGARLGAGGEADKSGNEFISH